MDKNDINELDPRLLGITSLNPFAGTDSSTRLYMQSGHLGNSVVISGGEECIIFSGSEFEFGKYTFKRENHKSGTIKKIFDLYKTNEFVKDSIKLNPLTVVIIENDDGEYDAIFLENYSINHPTPNIGFKFKPTSNRGRIKVGEWIPENTVFCTSPAINENGSYCYSINLNTALCSDRGTAEDGIVICKDVLPKLRFNQYIKRTISFGADRFPLNIYGTKDDYKPFPEIGEEIKPRVGLPEGLLCVLRKYDDCTSPASMSIDAMMQPDYMFDECVYTNEGIGRVVDVKVFHDVEKTTQFTSSKIVNRLLKYDIQRKNFYAEIIEYYNTLRRLHPEGVRLGNEFYGLIKEAYYHVGKPDKRDLKIKRNIRNIPLDEFTVEFTIEYTITPDIGYKLSDLNGAKGVIVDIREPDQMPMDADGNRADIIMDDKSVFNRMNIARIYIQGISACVVKLTQDIRKAYGLDKFKVKRNDAILAVNTASEDVYNYVQNRLLRFYEICSPIQHSWFKDGVYEKHAPFKDHIIHVLCDGIKLYMPTNNQPKMIDIVTTLAQEFKPCYGKVTFKGMDGKLKTSKYKMLIAPINYILLNNTPACLAAVSSSKLESHGFISHISALNRNTTPNRQNPARVTGESENRSLVAYLPKGTVALLFEMNSDEDNHATVIGKMLTSKHPTGEDSFLDLKNIVLGRNKPAVVSKHMFKALGIEFVYKPEMD